MNDRPCTGGIFSRPSIHLVIILITGLIVYSNTFGVPFQFDDVGNVVSNPAIKDTSNIPAFFAGKAGIWSSRPLLNATLSLNYYLGGLNTRGFHVLNTSFHLLNAALLYLLVLFTGRHLGYPEKDSAMTALLSALLFAAHPLQTEAVTYIVSRSMLFATAFYLLGMLLFLKAATTSGKKLFYVLALFVVSLGGMASREDFVTFPLMLALYDLFFVSRFSLDKVVRNWKIHVPAFLSLAYLTFLILNNTYDRDFEFPGEGIAPINYLLTQLRVHWTYLRLLLLPINQNIDYDYPVSQSLFEVPTLIAFCGYVGLWAASLRLHRRWPAPAFGILWFLIVLIPISFATAFMDLRLGDVLLEHRMYLASAGIIVAFAASTVYSLKNGERLRKAALSILLAAVLALLAAAYARNGVWADSVTLWSDVVSKSPMKARGYNNLALSYVSRGDLENAIDFYTRALDIAPGDAVTHSNLGRAFLANGNLDKAVEHFREAIRLSPRYIPAYSGLGHAYFLLGQADAAIEQYGNAIALNPADAEAHVNLALIYISKKEEKKAEEQMRMAMALGSYNADTYYAMGNAYAARNLFAEAIAQYEQALRLEPGNLSAFVNLGIAYKKTGQLDKAIESYKKAVELGQDSPEPYFNLANAYMQKGMVKEAITNYEKAVSLKPDEPGFHRNLAAAYRQMGMEQMAQEHLRRAEEISRKSEAR